MDERTLFMMWEPDRQSLINCHEFYVAQAKSRLFSQFESKEADAKAAAEEWLSERAHRFNPEREDPGSFYERAFDMQVEFYQLLSDMQKATRLSVVAGFYHEWEKKLREWIAQETRHWPLGVKIEDNVWSANFGKICDLFSACGWEIRRKDYFEHLDACRLVVNVYKHGKGSSLNDLKIKYPEYLKDSFAEYFPDIDRLDMLDHSHLEITDTHVEEFANAITAFWKDVPECICDSELTTPPQWLKRAIKNAQSKRQKNT